MREAVSVAVARPPPPRRRQQQLAYGSASLSVRESEPATGTESAEPERERVVGRKYFNGIKVARF
jgi:hypothetical protein